MGIAHFLYIGNQLVRNFPVIGIFFVILWCKEAAQIQFVYTDGRIFLLEGLSLLINSLSSHLKFRKSATTDAVSGRSCAALP